MPADPAQTSYHFEAYDETPPHGWIIVTATFDSKGHLISWSES